MDTFSYVISVTPTGSLLVNGSPAAPADGAVPPGDAQLEWALDQVGQQWEAAGRTTNGPASLTVTIDDQRDGGYGRQKTRLGPGQRATIESLRSRTGRNLAHWTPPSFAPNPNLATDSAVSQGTPVRVDDQLPTRQGPDSAASPTGPRRPADDTGTTPSGPTNGSAVAADLPTAALPATGGVPGPTSHPTSPPTAAPAQPEAPVERTEAVDPAAAPGGPASQSSLPSQPERPAPTFSSDQDLFQDHLERHQPADAAAPPAEPKRRSLFGRSAGSGKAPKGKGKASSGPAGKSGKPGSSKPKAAKPAASVGPTATKPSRSKPVKAGLLGRKAATPDPATGVPGTEAPPHPGWVKYVPKVKRPQLTEQEKAAAKKRESSPRTIVTVLITFVVAFAVFVIWDRSSNVDHYTAVCVDQRTAARVNTNAPCTENQAAYFRWWWVPDGSTVPSVGGEIDPQQGSFVEPAAEAPRHYGFAAEGGVYSSQ